jgi:hypothetical protein
MFGIPLVFDVIVIVLTTFKTYRLAAAVQRESGAVIVRPTLTPLQASGDITRIYKMFVLRSCTL